MQLQLPPAPVVTMTRPGKGKPAAEEPGGSRAKEGRSKYLDKVFNGISWAIPTSPERCA